LNRSYGRMTESPYVPKPLPSGVPIHMCFCGDPCKVDISEDETTYKQRYWMCFNFAWEPTQRRSTFIVRNCYCLLINLCYMKFCILIGFVTIAFVADPSTALWFWAVDRHWDQGGWHAASIRPEGVGCGASGDIREETQRGDISKGVQGRGGKETCCCVWKDQDAQEEGELGFSKN
jgi:hypothetical protein